MCNSTKSRGKKCIFKYDFEFRTDGKIFIKGIGGINLINELYIEETDRD
ncbi:MAG: hypothetical protein ACKO7P_10935 [Bacteroidota bacterium]